MRRHALLLFLVGSLLGCTAAFPPPAISQCLPEQGCTGASNTCALGAVLWGRGDACEEQVLDECADEAGQHLNFTSAGGFTCGNTATVASVAVTAPLESTGGTTPTLSIATAGIEASHLDQGSVGLSEVRYMCDGSSNQIVQYSTSGIPTCTISGGDVVGGFGALQLIADVVGTAELNDGTDTPSVGQCVKVDAADTSKFAYVGCRSGTPAPLPVFVPGSPTSGQLVYGTTIAFPMTCADDFAGGYFRAGTASAGNVHFDVEVNGVDIGDVTFATSATGSGTTSGGALTLAAGDDVDFIAPASADASLANVRMVLACTYTE